MMPVDPKAPTEENEPVRVPAHGAFPKIQILTIEGLLAGREQPRYPDLARGGHTFRQAKKEGGGGKQAGLFGGP